jgi:hypothetical protein
MEITSWYTSTTLELVATAIEDSNTSDNHYMIYLFKYKKFVEVSTIIPIKNLTSSSITYVKQHDASFK